MATREDDSIDEAVAAVRAGHRDRYRAVIETTRGSVTMVIAAIVPDLSVVDDVAHETFLTAFMKLREYRPGTDFRAWVKAIARRLALNERRRWLTRERGRRTYRVLLEEEAGAAAERFAEGVDARTQAELDDCVGRLAQATQRLVQRFYVEGKSSPEIAREEQRSESWVRVTLLRARAALATCLESKGIVPHG